MFCEADGCKEGTRRRAIAEQVFDPKLIEEVHLFKRGVEIDYILWIDARDTHPTVDAKDIVDGMDPWPMGHAHYFKSLAEAIAWYEANKESFIPIQTARIVRYALMKQAGRPNAGDWLKEPSYD